MNDLDKAIICKSINELDASSVTHLLRRDIQQKHPAFRNCVNVQKKRLILCIDSRLIQQWRPKALQCVTRDKRICV